MRREQQQHIQPANGRNEFEPRWIHTSRNTHDDLDLYVSQLFQSWDMCLDYRTVSQMCPIIVKHVKIESVVCISGITMEFMEFLE